MGTDLSNQRPSQASQVCVSPFGRTMKQTDKERGKEVQIAPSITHPFYSSHRHSDRTTWGDQRASITTALLIPSAGIHEDSQLDRELSLELPTGTTTAPLNPSRCALSLCIPLPRVAQRPLSTPPLFSIISLAFVRAAIHEDKELPAHLSVAQ